MKALRLICTIAAILVVALLSCGLVLASRKSPGPAVMKASLQQHGLGNDVRLTLADKTEVRGLIVGIGERSVSVREKHAGRSRELPYAQLIGVHSNRLSTLQLVGLGLVLVEAAIFAAAMIIAPRL